jgi:hypothetical protein
MRRNAIAFPPILKSDSEELKDGLLPRHSQRRHKGQNHKREVILLVPEEPPQRPKMESSISSMLRRSGMPSFFAFDCQDALILETFVAEIHISADYPP